MRARGKFTILAPGLAALALAAPAESRALALSASAARAAPGDTVSFTAAAPPPGPGTYAWDFDGDGTTDLTTSGPTAAHLYAARGAYAPSVAYVSPGGFATATTALTVSEDPVPAFTVTPGTARRGEALTFDGSASTSGPGVVVSYGWDWDGDGRVDERTSSPTVLHAFSDAGPQPVRLEVTNDLGAVALSEPHVVSITHQDPFARIYTPAGTTPGRRVELSAAGSSSPDGAVREYRWDLDGDGSFETSTGDRPTVMVAYPNPGTFRPAVQVTDVFGQSASAAGRLVVRGTPLPVSTRPVDRTPFVATLLGRPIQRAAAALDTGISVTLRSTHAASGRLTATLLGRRGALGSAAVILRPGRTLVRRLQLGEAGKRRLLAHLTAHSARVLVSGTLTDASGRRVRLTRVILLRT